MNKLKPLSRRSLPLLPCLFLGLALAGCQTLSTATAPQAAVAEACALYGPGITYSGTKDTAETVRQVEVKNLTFTNAGCDLGPGAQ